MPKKSKFAKPCIGDKIGDWTILEVPKTQKHKILCMCQCGGKHKVEFDCIVRGGSVKCSPCAQRERNIKHGDAFAVHGQCSRIYKIWAKMKERCLTKTCKHYVNYGARGIGICSEWVDRYEAFRDWALSNGYSDSLSIDRINNDLGYSPDNCRWATQKTQSRNTRRNRWLNAFGELKTIVEWSEDPRCLVSQGTLASRIRCGFPAELSIETPSNVGVFSLSARLKRAYQSNKSQKEAIKHES